MLLSLLLTAHLGLAAMWCGSMGYSLLVVQPKVARFGFDDDRLEEFLTLLAQGNRWKVVPIVAALLATAAAVAALTCGATRLTFLGALLLYAAAAAVFADVSWRHWPARVFALPEERPALRRALRLRAWTMLVLVGTAFAAALVTTVWAARC
ncbi:hypothetical protein Daura_42030 [Dactylosporangium aurantiacum]|uniref:Uncharacterized protein n=1 Tax=Dactylosporangium aurantiacum TaxID=35754 RepID=A0A9Q9ID59_9ACTN|nr:hypothetical protein [Dactylosporangium aurantiacum]MDG6102641.1 hypothetical protein [Dactylosporangium aurantiacum]UWZ53106.1 hypothetical protein Daura_42030 [Dactylosporangium aurantiacum]